MMKWPFKNKFSMVRKEYRQIRHFSQSACLEESGSPRLILLASVMICFICLIFILWSSFTTVDEVAVAKGEVIPVGQIQSIQHLEGGIIDGLLVEEGEKVVLDQVLLKLNPKVALSELDKMRSQHIALTLALFRQRAFVQDQPLDKQALLQVLLPMSVNQDKAQLHALIADNIELLAFQRALEAKERNILTLQMQQREEENSEIATRRSNLSSHIKLLEDERQIYQQLQSTDSVSQVSLLDIGRRLNKAQGDLLALDSDQLRRAQQLEEAKVRLSVRLAQLRKDALDEITANGAQLLELEMSMQRLQDRVDRLVVRAPVEGIVKGLTVYQGSVVPSGSVLMDIVPLDQELVVEAKLATKDIGHIQVGDNVQIKVTTFDFVRYGQIPGVVKTISASTFVDESGTPYYKAIIHLKKSYVGTNPVKHAVLPGMLVLADIVDW